MTTKDEKKAEKLDQFIADSKEKFDDLFDYLLTTKIDNNYKVNLICTKHGKFICNIYNHLRSDVGCCNECAKEKKLKIEEEKFFEECKTIHNDFYDYTDSHYRGSKCKLKIKCPIHGVFEQLSKLHKMGKGCKKCGTERARKKKLEGAQERFETRATKIHEEKYDYSLVEYKNDKTKVKIICPEHGIFEQTPANHVGNKSKDPSGCPKCGSKRTGDKQKFTIDQFRERAYEIHGDKYDYSYSIYNGMNKLIDIMCKVEGHGIFTQLAGEHIRKRKGKVSGSGCPKCVGRDWTYEEIIEKCIEKHKGYYSYNKTKCVILDDIVTITCPKHGDFKQKLSYHMNGTRCGKCAGQNLTKDEAIERCKEIHGDKYNYSDMKYINMSTLTNVRCKKHGEFKVKLTDHCNKKKGCPKCSGYFGYTQEDFIEVVTKQHKGYYDYSKSDYTKATDIICIICPKHGEFYQRARDHMDGYGCKLCAKRGISNKQLEWLTCLNVDSEGTIEHYGNGGEHLVKGSLYRADGYCPKTNTIFEFHGDYFHGNPEIYHPNTINSINGRTMGELYKETLEREEYIKSVGYNLKVVWEFDWIYALHSVKLLQRKWREEVIKFSKPKAGVWTVEKFLEKAKKAHPDIEYDYSRITKPVSRYDEVEIGCPVEEHGYFKQVVHNHIAKHGCQLCGIKKSASAQRSTTEKFKKNAKKIHGELYDYSEVDYIDENTLIIIICQIHGKFTQKPVNHLKGNGCKECGYEKNRKQFSLGRDKFIENAIAKFGDLYDYSLVVYVNISTPVKVICQKHGEFMISPYLHTRMGKNGKYKNHGHCQKCSHEMALERRRSKMVVKVL